MCQLCQTNAHHRGGTHCVLIHQSVSFSRGRGFARARPAAPAAAEPTQAPAPALPPPPPVFTPEPTGELVTGVECPEPEGLQVIQMLTWPVSSIVKWNQVYPNPDSCHQFYKCANGTLTLETCGNGLLFNEVLVLVIWTCMDRLAEYDNMIYH